MPEDDENPPPDNKDDDADSHIRRIIDAFNSALTASLSTLAKADISKLNNYSPDDFAVTYCEKPLEVFGIKITNLEIRKEHKSQFYSLPERQQEFVPILRLNELVSKDTRLEVALDAEDGVLEYELVLIYYINGSSHISLDDVKIIEVKKIPGKSGDLMRMIDAYVPLTENITKAVVSALVIEAIKKVLGV